MLAVFLLAVAESLLGNQHLSVDTEAAEGAPPVRERVASRGN